MDYSQGKIISKLDDSSKAFQIKCLDGLPGKGIDVDTLYYSKNIDINGNIVNNNYKFYFFEYLKDQSEFCSPWKSDPNKYKWNWRKFYTLNKLAKLVNGELILVNYNNDGLLKDGKQAPENYLNEVRVMYVNEVDKEACEFFAKCDKNTIKKYLKDYITYKSEKCMTFEEYKKWIQIINNNSSIKF